MSDNKNLTAAKRIKNDEFYTRLEDIEKELTNYKEYFKDKIIYCNCDDVEYSNFYKYFKENFYELGIKKIIATNLSLNKTAYKTEFDNNSKEVRTQLCGNGDFRSEECVELLKSADFVITNPPFSLFREYIAQLIKYNKKFLVIGNMNAATYKEIFPLFKNNQVWFGNTSPKVFLTPDRTEKKFGNIIWYTNLDNEKRHCRIPLKEKYYGNEEKYPKYDNYDAIEVSKVVNIPCDYDGLMGVPVTFLSKYCPEQFQLIGHDHDLTGDGGAGISDGQFICNGKNVYKRVLIKLVKNS